MNSRRIPSIDALMQEPDVVACVAAEGRSVVVDALRVAADAWRHGGAPEASEPGAWIIAHARQVLETASAPSLRPVINATGVIIHTNLGRAPLARAAVEAAASVAAGFSNLEYDLDAGGRGHRHAHAERLICALTGAEAAAVTNNNAAATWLVLATLSAGREVIVSRGELVEIGGGFRVPDIMAQSGATLREVGTTNRTRLSDYAAAINDRTALLLRVHPSNFRIEGFTERPSLGALAELAHQFDRPLFEDLGSGWLGLPHPGGWPEALAEEPSVGDSIRAGADVVSFSGDKLLGGPQAGIIAGRRSLVDQVRRHPLMRAVRAGKQTYAALESTLALWRREPSRLGIPVVRMLLETTEALEARARAIVKKTSEVATSEVFLDVVEGVSTVGGGSAPQATLPTRLVSIRSRRHSSAEIETALRADATPVIARIQHDAVLLDLRTVAAEDDAAVVAAVRRSVQPRLLDDHREPVPHRGA
jgi:L-seryl-tRNA(Ser) seleniumtransferase